ncbi:hypothetical protein DM01DRAFT_323384 [Hesseltinella vesiculosa]|uniref:Uncharacterized protein n=1 Tax=Hesseltinella vesiculosa TaxID=101127 RepID=A0A1X2GLY8_9FUNG|nr:hypothetical protein DM01DRAFT_323384 [Hesseltinella vesiculosa]
MALSKCELDTMADIKDSCRCSAQKQMLACFSECSQDPATFELEERQINYIKESCGGGAELEAAFVANVASPDDEKVAEILMHHDFGKSHAELHDASAHSLAAAAPVFSMQLSLFLLSITLFAFLQC